MFEAVARWYCFIIDMDFLEIQIYNMREKDETKLINIVLMVLPIAILGFLYVYNVLGVEEGIDAVNSFLSTFTTYVGLAGAILSFKNNEKREKQSNVEIKKNDD